MSFIRILVGDMVDNKCLNMFVELIILGYYNRTCFYSIFLVFGFINKV